MKKLAAVIISFAILVLSVPVPVKAISDDTTVINKHGTKTYMGTYSAWSDKTWDESEFTDVTGEDVDCSNVLIIKGGKLGNVSVTDDSSLTIYDGSMEDVTCDGSINMNGGTVGSLQSDDDISMNGGIVKKDLNADDIVTLSGKLLVSGSVTGKDVSVYASDSSGSTAVSGVISFSDLMTLQGTNYKLGKIDGQSSGTLEFKNFYGAIPDVSDVNIYTVRSNSTVTASGALKIKELNLEENASFVTTSTLTADTIDGPGALVVDAGKLTVNSAVSGYPIFDFNNTAGDGTTVFQAGTGKVSTGGVIVYGYSLTQQSTDGSYDSFALKTSTGNGVSLNASSANVGTSQYFTVKATSVPSMSDLPAGTKLNWKLIDPASKFIISPNAGDNTCKIYLSSSAGTTAYHAMLGVYLADSNGDAIAGYKTACCFLSSANATSPDSSGASVSLDTTSVNIPIGSTYSVLAVTTSQKPPVQSSYNSAVAVVGKASAYNSNGKVGWVYPVTAIAKGGVTINIGGQKMSVAVTSGSIVVDTSSYTLSPGKTFTIGVKLNGVDKSNINVHSANGCTMVQDQGKAVNGVELYRVKAQTVGTGYILFDTAAGGSVKTQINIVKGAASRGVSARLTAIA